jgi:hypothetical protein
MLTEDLHLGVMPIGWAPDRFKFQCKIEPASSVVEQLLCASFPTHHGQPHYLTEAICDFVEEATHILACFGKAFYEIVYEYNDDARSKIESFRLEHISNTNIHNFGPFYWQLLPANFSRDPLSEETKRGRFIWLPRQNIFVLNFPKELGGSFKLKKIVSQLVWASKETMPKFSMKDLELQKQQPGYDFSVYRDNQDIFVLKLTKELGWPARSLSSEKLLEFYQLYRYLKFEQTKAVIREYILKELNRVLGRIGKKIGFKAKIVLVNCLSAKNMDDNISQFIAGKLQFSELLKISKFY